MFPFSSMFQDPWSGNRAWDERVSAPWSDDEEYCGGRRASRQPQQRQPHRQPIKTPVESRNHHQPQATHYNPYSRASRSAPSSPRDGHATAFDQHQYPHQQQRQKQPTSSGQARAQGAAPSTAGVAARAGASRAAATAKQPARAAAKLSPDAAATRIQTAWRCWRLARHRAALKELASAAATLRGITERAKAVQQEQPGMPLTQKQYLELSEPVMKVMFALDAVSCGAPELRARRKELTTWANKLLDDLQAAYKAKPDPAAAAAAAAAAQAAAVQQQQQPAAKREEQPQEHKSRKWFRR